MLDEQQTKTKNLIKVLCQYSVPTKSEALNKKEEALFTETSRDQQKLREIFVDSTTSDMASVRIPDFLKLSKLYHTQIEKTKQLDAEVTVPDMIT